MAGVDMLLESALRNLENAINDGGSDLTRMEINLIMDARINIREVMKLRKGKRRTRGSTKKLL